MNSSQWKMDAQGILPPLIKRVDFQLPHLHHPPLHPSLDLNPSSPGLSGQLSCTPPFQNNGWWRGLYLDSVWLVLIIT